MFGQSIHAAICSRLFRLFLASDLVLKQIHLASGLVLPYSLPNKSFKPSPLRGLGHTGPQRAGRLNSGVRPQKTDVKETSFSIFVFES